MSKHTGKQNGGERQISHIAHDNNQQRNYEGFEGMNYEQVRQPYNPKFSGRNKSQDERADGKRPDEG